MEMAEECPVSEREGENAWFAIKRVVLVSVKINYIISQNNILINGLVIELQLSFSETQFLNFNFGFKFGYSMHLIKKEIILWNLFKF